MDLLTIAGIVVAIGAILGGQALEGGHIGSILQLTAFIIVMGGTIGAVMVQNPMNVFLHSLKLVGMAFLSHQTNMVDTVKQVVEMANLSRKQGLLAIEEQIKTVHDAFMKKGLQLIVDGTDAAMLREILEIEAEHEEETAVNAAKVWEAAGGYSPTIGILGAVMGLIHVMENLADPSKLGGGIAVAFVATIYGVGAANLLFLPVANKIKIKVKQEATLRAMMIAGLVGIAQGDNPRMIQEKIEGYLPHHLRPKKDGDHGKA